MKNLFFIDFETGGLKSWVNGVCSFNIQDLAEFNRTIYFYPQKKVYEYAALEVNGLNLDDLYNMGSSREVLFNFFERLSKNNKYIVLAGWNVMFDIEFLLNIYKEKGVKLPCAILALDLMEIARKNVPKIDKRKKESVGVEDYKLTSVFQYYFADEYDESKSHTAEYDVYMTKRLYSLFIENGWIDK